MNVLASIYGAPTIYQSRPSGPEMVPQHPRELYKLLRLYYLNNGLYEDLHLMLYQEGIWKEGLKPLRNPAYRVVEFYVAHLWPGQLPDALPIATDNERIIDPLHRIWAWSNWGAQKQVAARWLANYGDLFIKAVQPEGRAYLQLIDPQYVSEFDEDERGYVQYIRLDIPQTEREGDKVRSFIHTEVWDKASAIYRRWRHEQGLDVALEQLGAPAEERELAEFGIDFVPFVHAKMLDIGEERGVGAFTLSLDKIDEANRQATRLHQMLFRFNKPFLAVRANHVDAAGRPVPAPRLGSNGTGSDGDTIDLGDDRLLRLPGNSSLESLVPNIDYAAALAILNAQLDELEQDLPELAFYRLRQGGELSGRAIQLLLADAIAKAEEARGNAETALARVGAMTLTLAGVGKLAGFGDIGNYEAGDFEHHFQRRDVIPIPESERAETAKTYIDMGVPLKTVLRRELKWSQANLDQLDEDLADAQQAQQQTLAAAVLNAQRQLDSGQAETGLSQP